MIDCLTLKWPACVLFPKVFSFCPQDIENTSQGSSDFWTPPPPFSIFIDECLNEWMNSEMIKSG